MESIASYSGYWAASIDMMLGTASFLKRVIFGPLSLKNVMPGLDLYVPDEHISDCIRRLEHRSIQIERREIQNETNNIYYATSAVDVVPLSGLKLYDYSPKHLTVSSWDISPRQIEHSSLEKLSRVETLDISVLDLEDDDLINLLTSVNFVNLKWLDLSGNAKLTELGVRQICRKVQSLELRNLLWLDLLGTECDATPYADGNRWRISTPAHKLALDFGYQEWMMLGSRDPDMEAVELLPEQVLEASMNRLTA